MAADHNHPRLSVDDGPLCWETWKQRAEAAGLPEHLSDTAIMLLYIALGNNAWRTSQ